MGNDSAFINMLANSVSHREKIEIELKNTVVFMLCRAMSTRGLTQKTLAQLLGVSQPTVSRWLSGDTNFSLRTISTICDRLGILELSFKFDSLEPCTEPHAEPHTEAQKPTKRVNGETAPHAHNDNTNGLERLQ